MSTTPEQLADQLAAAATAGHTQVYLDSLRDIAAGGMSAAMNVIRVLMPMHNPEASRAE